MRTMSRKSIGSEISPELRSKIDNPLIFKVFSGDLAHGYEASILVEVCDMFIEARNKNKLLPTQIFLADQSEIIIRSVAQVGIIALVDEATGYQYDRARNSLEKILDKFISTELRKWAKTFPDEFYEEMFRLRGWQYVPFSAKRPSVVGKYTNDLVYERLAPFVIEELKKITPRDSKGRHKHRLFQRLTEDVGHPRLREHLAAIIALMKASSNWNQFYRLVQRALPKYGDQRRLLMNEPEVHVPAHTKTVNGKKVRVKEHYRSTPD